MSPPHVSQGRGQVGRTSASSSPQRASPASQRSVGSVGFSEFDLDTFDFDNLETYEPKFDLPKNPNVDFGEDFAFDTTIASGLMLPNEEFDINNLEMNGGGLFGDAALTALPRSPEKCPGPISIFAGITVSPSAPPQAQASAPNLFPPLTAICYLPFPAPGQGPSDILTEVIDEMRGSHTLPLSPASALDLGLSEFLMASSIPATPQGAPFTETFGMYPGTNVQGVTHQIPDVVSVPTINFTGLRASDSGGTGAHSTPLSGPHEMHNPSQVFDREQLLPPNLMPNGRVRNKVIGGGRGNKEDDPKTFYHQLPFAPSPWGGQKGHTFQYTDQGELVPMFKFSPWSQFLEYIVKPGLMLVIQKTPGQHNHRYPNGASNKCRFKCCGGQHNTIGKGDFRVALVEHPHLSGTALDPFINAGYVHLWCLEKGIDIVDMLTTGKLDFETRQLKLEERNPMSIPTQHRRAAAKWYKEELQANRGQHWRQREGLERTLTQTLHKVTLARQGESRQKIRDSRGGVDFGRHLGNLSLMMKYRDEKRAHKRRSVTLEKEPRQYQPEMMFGPPPDDVLQPDSLLPAGVHHMGYLQSEFAPILKQQSLDRCLLAHSQLQPQRAIQAVPANLPTATRAPSTRPPRLNGQLIKDLLKRE